MQIRLFTLKHEKMQLSPANVTSSYASLALSYYPRAAQPEPGCTRRIDPDGDDGTKGRPRRKATATGVTSP